MIDALELSLRIAAGVGLGAAIGIERQWRSKMAGLRTNALVSPGSALFVVMGAYAFGSGDPTRVAAQVASGIGFLGAGVIIKQGVSISGLNTAAAGGAFAVIAANVLLRPTPSHHRRPQLNSPFRSADWFESSLELMCCVAAAAFRAEHRLVSSRDGGFKQ